MVSSINVVPAMIAKILTKNGQFLHRSMYHVSTGDEWSNEVSNKECRMFVESVHHKLCPQATVDDLADLGTKVFLSMDHMGMAHKFEISSTV